MSKEKKGSAYVSRRKSQLGMCMLLGFWNLPLTTNVIRLQSSGKSHLRRLDTMLARHRLVIPTIGLPGMHY